jgi:HK97 family phage prohead protease
VAPNNALNQSFGGEGLFEGYASLFYCSDLGGDTLMPGAFTETLARRGAQGIRLLWQHDPAQPLGRWLSIQEDCRGLRVRGALNLQVQRAVELFSLIQNRSLDGLSIGFRSEKAYRDRQTGGRRIHKLDLWEISLVTFPMLPKARVLSTEQCSKILDEKK